MIRVLDSDALADFQSLEATGFWTRSQESGRIIGTHRLTKVPSEPFPGWAGALEHDRVRVVSYPFEWTFSMLRDAALLHLELLEDAIADGFITKDGTAYNVQFRGAEPTFIDVGSFTRLRPGEQWYGFRQFCEQFLNPLVLQAYGRLDLPDSLGGSVNGISPRVAARLLSRRTRLRPALLATIFLHAAAERRYADRRADVGGELRAAGLGPAVLLAQVRKLRKTIERLRWKAGSSEWSGYGERSHYGDAARAAKEAFVARVVRGIKPSTVLDLGANDGAFSRLALENGAEYVVALDVDGAVVDRLYLDLVSTGERRILPLCVDLTDMSGGLGWGGVERSSLLERIRPDLVLCLALVHHLAISASIRMGAIVDLLARFNAAVVLELPLPGDAMAQRLMNRKRDKSVPGYDRPSVESELGRRFRIAGSETLPGGTRLLYDLRPR